MGLYINWEDVVNRYSIAESPKDDQGMQDTYIQYAEAYVEAQLAGHYTVPFSSNNLTVKDLCIDWAFAKMWAYKDHEKADAIMTSVNSMLGALKNGEMQMATGSGTLGQQSPLWSSTEDYHPTFGVGDEADFHVSSQRLYDEEIARDY